MDSGNDVRVRHEHEATERTVGGPGAEATDRAAPAESEAEASGMAAPARDPRTEASVCAAPVAVTQMEASDRAAPMER